MTEQECKEHILWDKFKKVAEQKGIPLEYYEDWNEWWEVFLVGAEAGADISEM